MHLPGGITTRDGPVERDGRIRAIDGRLELELWEACAEGGSRAQRIDRLIDAAVEFDAEAVRAADLATGDRQFIMAELARHFACGPFWNSVTCTDCGTLYDVCIDLDRLPATPAGAGYPYATARLAAGEARIRVPNGADQAAVADIGDTMEAIAELARRCIVTPGLTLSADPETRDEELASIDAALQDMAPQIATSVTSRCPDCGASDETAFDTAALFFASVANPLPELHDIAMDYHWSETEILALPRARRRAYLALIDSETGSLR